MWDVLQLPTGDVRGRPYTERRAMLLDLLAALPSPTPIQAVSATDDPEVVRAWYHSLQRTEVEGVVAKLASSPYRAGRSSSWKKVRHAETVDAEIVGVTGQPSRPGALAVRLTAGRTALSQRLDAPLAVQAAMYLMGCLRAGVDEGG